MLGKKRKLLAAARNNDVDGIKQHYMPRAKCLEACLEAVTHNAPDALRALLQKNTSWDFSNSYSNDERVALKLVNMAKKAKHSGELLTVLFEENKRSRYKYISDAYFINDNAPLPLLQECLEENVNNFGDCLYKVGLHDTAKLRFILTFTPKSDDGQRALDKALVETAAAGDVDKTSLLLDRGANPNYAGAQALERAAAGGHIDILRLLLDKTDLAQHGKDIATRLEQIRPETAGLIAAATEIVGEQTTEEAENIKYADESEQAANVDESMDNYVRLDDHTLAETQRLPDGGTLTTLFNFAVGQQQIILSPASGNALPPVIVNFSDIAEDLIATLKNKFSVLAEKQALQTGEDRKHRAEKACMPEKARQSASTAIVRQIKDAGL